MILSRERLALHDYVAKTRVFRMGRVSFFRRASVALLVLIGLFGSVSFLRQIRPSGVASTAQEPNEPSALGSVLKQISAVVTLYIYDPEGKPSSLGSGFLITDDGVGVTNFHVLKDAFSAEAKLGDGRIYHVLAVHAFQANHDIAIFQLGRRTSLGVEAATNLSHVELSSERVRVGDRVTTVGSPEGLSNTVSDGLVSAIRGDAGEQYFQITAPISHGSSGGPVFNLKGQVVAITSFQSREGQNLNFAIPVSEVAAISNQRENLPLEQLYKQTHVAGEPAARPETVGRAAPTPRGGLTGSFWGTAHNLTANVTAGFGIIVEERQGLLQGCLGVKAPLYGSGPLQGSVQGDDVQFDVNGASIYMHFEGRNSADGFRGIYSAYPPGGGRESGEFTLERQRSKQQARISDPQKDCPTDTDMNN